MSQAPKTDLNLGVLKFFVDSTSTNQIFSEMNVARGKIAVKISSAHLQQLALTLHAQLFIFADHSYPPLPE